MSELREQDQDSRVDLSFMINNWPSPIVARSEIGKFTGGMLSPGTMANLDSEGQGPDGAIRIGRKAGYQVADFVRWLEGRASWLRAPKQVRQNSPKRHGK